MVRLRSEMKHCRIKVMTKGFASRGDAIDLQGFAKLPTLESATEVVCVPIAYRSRGATFVGRKRPIAHHVVIPLLSADNVTLSSS